MKKKIIIVIIAILVIGISFFTGVYVGKETCSAEEDIKPIETVQSIETTLSDVISIDDVAYIKCGEYGYWELMLKDDYRYDWFVTSWEQETGWKAQRNESAEWVID